MNTMNKNTKTRGNTTYQKAHTMNKQNNAANNTIASRQVPKTTTIIMFSEYSQMSSEVSNSYKSSSPLYTNRQPMVKKVQIYPNAHDIFFKNFFMTTLHSMFLQNLIQGRNRLAFQVNLWTNAIV